MCLSLPGAWNQVGDVWTATLLLAGIKVEKGKISRPTLSIAFMLLMTSWVAHSGGLGTECWSPEESGRAGRALGDSGLWSMALETLGRRRSLGVSAQQTIFGYAAEHYPIFFHLLGLVAFCLFSKPSPSIRKGPAGVPSAEHTPEHPLGFICHKSSCHFCLIYFPLLF